MSRRKVCDVETWDQGLGAQCIAGLGRFIEDQTGGFFACLVELLIQDSSPLALTIESLRRLRFLVGGSFQLTLKVDDVVFGSHHLLVKLVEVPINLAWDNVLIDRAESRPMWCVSPWAPPGSGVSSFRCRVTWPEHDLCVRDATPP